MVSEQEDRYEEDGEYHFSDDQMNYDAASETLKSKPTAAFTKELIASKFSQYRKGILGGISVIILITIVYKTLIPSSAPPPTDFSKAVAVKTVKPMPIKVAAVKSLPPPAPVASMYNQSQPANQQNQTSTALPPAMTSPNQSSMVRTPAATPPIASALPHEVNTQAKNVVDRLTTLEQQNTAMMNLLQTEYAQKIADSEAQQNATRGKLEEVTKRMNQMEANVSQMTELLKGMSKYQSQTPNTVDNGSGSVSDARSMEPKVIYSVQAIIPGRAWLKSESGDTVTVAEGDYLKNYGRVTKIDPYDGVVAIDTGKKVITLSYGMGSD